MKHFLVSFTVILFFISCSKPPELTREEVMESIHTFDRGWKSKNAKVVDSTLGPRYIYFTQSGGIFDRASVVHTAESAEYKLDSVSRQIIDIRITGNTAVVNTQWIGIGSYFGNEFNDNQRCSIFLIKLDGKVEILSEHCTPIQ